MKANVGISHAGVCALAIGIIIIEAPIKSVKKIAIAAAVLAFVISHFSPLFFKVHSKVHLQQYRLERNIRLLKNQNVQLIASIGLEEKGLPKRTKELGPNPL